MSAQFTKSQQGCDADYPALSGLGHITADAVLNQITMTNRRVSIGLIDEHGTIMMMNQFAARSYGVESPREMIGREYTDLPHPQWAEELLGYMHQSIENDQTVVVLTIKEGHRIQSQVVPIRANQSDTRASASLIMCEEISPETYDLVVSTRSEDRFVVHSKLVGLGPLDVLSRRELEVLAHMRLGLRTKDIAAQLHRSPSTILRHRESIGKKLGLADRSAIIELANTAVLQFEDAQRTRLLRQAG